MTKLLFPLVPLALGAACAVPDLPGAPEDLAVLEEALDIDIPNIPNRIYELGQGIDTMTQEFRSKCVVNDAAPIRRTTGRGLVVYDKQMSAAQLDAMFGVDTNVKARYGAVNGSARASFNRSAQSRRTSINVVFGATYDLAVEKFPEVGARALPVANWYSDCGDGFVSQISYGADLAILYRIDFASEADKMAFEASVSANYAELASGDLNISAAASAFRTRASVRVEVHQFGGDISKMAGAIAGQDHGAAATECAIDNLSACNRLVAQGIDYASGEFAASVASQPGVRFHAVKDYGVLHIDRVAHDVPADISEARADLAERFDTELEIQDRIASLSRGGFSLSTAHRQKLERFALQSDRNQKALRAIVGLCFDKLDLAVPATLRACTDALTADGLASRRYLALEVTDLDFPRAGSAVRNAAGEVVRSDFWQNITLGTSEWGTWRGWEYCDADQYAIGYSLAVEGGQGAGDDTALNAVTLECGRLDHSGAGQTIDSYPGLWGTQHPYVYCGGGVVRGGKMKIEAWQGDGDDTGANDVVLLCSDGDEIHAPGGGAWGKWGAEQKDTAREAENAVCPPGTAVCGINSRFQEHQHAGDDTGLNGLMFACCSF